MSAAGVTGATHLAGERVAHRYGSRHALEPLDFAIDGPGLVAVTGPNGSGKSTLLRVLAGLLRPTVGTTRLAVGGRAIAPRERRHVVGLASPELHFYDELTARENLAFAAEARSLAVPARAASAALDAVGLGSRADDPVSALSSGMKQRLRLAFARLHDPAVLLLDEPGSHLDAEGFADFERAARAEAANRLVVLATNEPREWSLAERRIELSGRGLGHPS